MRHRSAHVRRGDQAKAEFLSFVSPDDGQRFGDLFGVPLRLLLRGRLRRHAAVEAHAGQKWIYLREDALLPVVLRFFEQRIFGPMRLDKLEKQLRASTRERSRDGKLTTTRLRQQVAHADRRIKA